MAEQKVTCLTENKLRELAERPHPIVYKPTHDIVYAPWSASRVREAVVQVVKLTRRGVPSAEIRQNTELDEFAAKYTVFFQKLTDVEFVADEEHVKTVLRLVVLKELVEQGVLDEEAARAQSADCALKSLASRVKSRS
jgi:hypothetical protein